MSPTASVGSLLGSRPLRWIGLRSYGIYLWGIAIFEFTRPGSRLCTAHRSLALVARVVLVTAVVEISFRYIETPVRSGAFAAAWNELRAGDRRTPARAATAVAGRSARSSSSSTIGRRRRRGRRAAARRPADHRRAHRGRRRRLRPHGEVRDPDRTDRRRRPLRGNAHHHDAEHGPTTPTPRRPTPVVRSEDGRSRASATRCCSARPPTSRTRSPARAGGGVLINAAVSRHAGTCLQVLQAFAARVAARTARDRALRQQRRARRRVRRPGDADRGPAPQRDVRQPEGAALVAGHRQRRARGTTSRPTRTRASSTGTTSAAC